MDKLIKRDESGNAGMIGADSTGLQTSPGGEKSAQLQDALDRLAELEELLERHQLLELPCSVGAALYEISYVGTPVEEKQAERIEISKDGLCIYAQDNNGGQAVYEPADFGETVFLTREAAELELQIINGMED